MEIRFSNGPDRVYQEKLNALLQEIFFDFQFWYDLDLWDQNYESYSIMVGDEIVSNICVYKAKVLFRGQPYTALSVGAVATREDYRGKGLARKLMEHIIEKYPDTPMYLCANDGVLGFYPRFGFKRVYEKQPVVHCRVNNSVSPLKLTHSDPKVWHYVYNRINFSKELDCLNTACINIFHIYQGYLNNSLYEIPELETMVIADQEGPVLSIRGVFSLRPINFAQLLPHLPFSGVENIEFGFMPYWPDLEYEMEERETDPWFVRGVKCDLGDIKFPELSIT